MSEGEVAPYRAAAIAVVAALLLGAAVILIVPRMLASIASQTSPAVGEAAIEIILFGLLMVVASVFGRWQRQTIWRGGHRPDSMVPMAFVLGVSGVIFATLFAWLAASIVPGTGGGASTIPFLLGSVTILVQATGEESYVRGWLQPLLQRAIGGRGGIVASALIFTTLHLVVGARAPITLLNLFLAGGFFGLLAWRTGGMVAPIAAHFGWNWVEQQWLGLDPNPGIGPFGTLFNYDLTGAAIWGGSGEGLNASLATTFVLCALGLPLLVGHGVWRESVATSEPEPAQHSERHAWLVGDEA